MTEVKIGQYVSIDSTWFSPEEDIQIKGYLVGKYQTASGQNVYRVLDFEAKTGRPVPYEFNQHEVIQMHGVDGIETFEDKAQLERMYDQATEKQSYQIGQIVTIDGRNVNPYGRTEEYKNKKGIITKLFNVEGGASPFPFGKYYEVQLYKGDQAKGNLRLTHIKLWFRHEDLYVPAHEQAFAKTVDRKPNGLKIGNP